MKNVYLVGQYKSGQFPAIVWELAGVYSDIEKARSACIDVTDFMVKIEINRTAPRETMPFPKTIFPNLIDDPWAASMLKKPEHISADIFKSEYQGKFVGDPEND